MKRAIFPGSFDPYTIGHADIVARGLELFDEIVIAVGKNCQKQGSQSIDERVQKIRNIYKEHARIRVRSYECLTIDLAREEKADFILRGVRSAIDFEYERQIADANRALSGIETVLLYSRPELSHISSTLLRDLQSYGHDISAYLPSDAPASTNE